MKPETCPIPEIAGLGKTLTLWRAAFLAYFCTGRSGNGGAEAINRLIELHRRISPAASATATTTGYGCSWSEADLPTPT